MSNKQTDIGVGSVFAAPIAESSQAFTQSKVPKLGTKVRFDDGREYVFCSTALDITVGQLVGMAAPSAELANSCTAAAIGATSVTIATSTLAANTFADGYLHIVDDTGTNYTYRIKSHTAGTTTVAAVFTLYDPLIVALDTTSDVVLSPCPFRSVIVNTATTVPVGMAVRTTTAATAGVTQYFWVQTRGACTLIGTGTLGKPLHAAAAGAVAVAAADDTNHVGICIQTQASGEVSAWLQL